MVERRRRSLSSSSEIGKYQVRRPIRVQNDRALLEAYDPFLDRSVAIKTIQLSDPASPTSRQFNETFFSEARAIGRLQHNNIVSVYDAGMGDYEGYIVMEYVEGKSLEEILKEQTKLPIKQVINIALQICDALQCAHSKNIIHRDIKPSNIMLTQDQQVKLVDFGISVDRGRQSNMPEFVGTPSYIAPELIDVGVPNQLSDQFSLGVLLYEMVRGELPFTGKDIHSILYKIMYQEPEPISTYGFTVPPLFRNLIFKCLAKNPQDRFLSLQELEAALNNLLNNLDKIFESENSADTQKLIEANVFVDIDEQALSELSACCVFELYEADHEIQSIHNETTDDYYCLLAGKVMLESMNKQTKVSEKQWFYSPASQVKYPAIQSKTLSDVRVLRVSSKALESKSLATQLYFYKSVSDQLYLHAS